LIDYVSQDLELLNIMAAAKFSSLNSSNWKF